MCAAGDSRPVAAAFPDDRGALSGYGAFIYRSNADNNLAVTGNDISGLRKYDITFLQTGKKEQ